MLEEELRGGRATQEKPELVVWRLLEGKLELSVVEEVTVEEVQVRDEGEEDC